ncbi:MAG TPA: PA14 domain-containing protein [Patescibacteria group bacterium]|nr:PA14 domain-containing protein [Patescibacteria group bacterium]
MGNPRFDGGLKMERNDAQIDFNWEPNPPGPNTCNDNYSVNWTGYVFVPSEGQVRFGATSDDGFAIDLETSPGTWIRVFEDWSEHSSRTRWGNWYNFPSGWYSIRVWYFQHGWQLADAVLRIQTQAGGQRVVPSAYLRTCSPPTGTVQGSKVLMPDNTPAFPASSQSIFLDGGSETITNPYIFNSVSTGSHTVSVSAPGGYLVQSTLCYNRTDCHTTACVNNDAGCPVAGAGANGSSRTVDVPSGGYADLNWHYTLTNPWVQALGGDIFANHLVGLRVAPTGLFNARWGIFGRGSVTGSSQENWLAQYYPERNFDLTQNTPVKAPEYDTLFQRFGGGATTYAGPTLPNSSGVYLIDGNKTVNGVFNQAAGTSILVFVNGNLTIEGEIRVPSNSVIAFIVSGDINFSKSLAGGGGAVDSIGGVYISEGRINTAYDKDDPDETTRQLVVEGSLISLKDTISLDRNLDDGDNNTTPAEQINLSGKYYVLLKSILGRPKFFYREVPAGF